MDYAFSAMNLSHVVMDEIVFSEETQQDFCNFNDASSSLFSVSLDFSHLWVLTHTAQRVLFVGLIRSEKVWLT